MDINTKRGQSSLNYERDAIEKFSLIHPEYRFIETPKDRPAAVDGVFMKGGVLHSVLEVKVRNMTRAKLRDSFDDTWLVTMDKVEAGRTSVHGPLSDDDVICIRWMYHCGRFSQNQIASIFWGDGTGQSRISKIVTGAHYAHLPGPITHRGQGTRPSRRDD